MAKKCDECGKPLGPKRRRFCCNPCKDKWHNRHNPRGKDADDWEACNEDPGDDLYWCLK